MTPRERAMEAMREAAAHSEAARDIRRPIGEREGRRVLARALHLDAVRIFAALVADEPEEARHA